LQVSAREALKIESHSKNGGVMNFALAILTLGAWVLMSQKMPTWNWFNKVKGWFPAPLAFCGMPGRAVCFAADSGSRSR
jgi:hypothetical protein